MNPLKFNFKFELNAKKPIPYIFEYRRKLWIDKTSGADAINIILGKIGKLGIGSITYEEF